MLRKKFCDVLELDNDAVGDNEIRFVVADDESVFVPHDERHLCGDLEAGFLQTVSESVFVDLLKVSRAKVEVQLICSLANGGDEFIDCQRIRCRLIPCGLASGDLFVIHSLVQKFFVHVRMIAYWSQTLRNKASDNNLLCALFASAAKPRLAAKDEVMRRMKRTLERSERGFIFKS